MCSSFFGHHRLSATPLGTLLTTTIFTFSLCAKHNVPCVFSSVWNLDQDLAASSSTISCRQLPWSSSSHHSNCHFRHRCNCDQSCWLCLSFLTKSKVVAAPENVADTARQPPPWMSLLLRPKHVDAVPTTTIVNVAVAATSARHWWCQLPFPCVRVSSRSRLRVLRC